MKIAVEGCAHGELQTIYDTIKALEEKEKIKVDLLICCGDFQACRNEQDLHCMAVPQKYYNMCTFYKYYNGEKEAPILTIFIGGNHEASNYLQELPYGGWVAPNIYYLGYAGVINIAGVRIGGISGIYKGQDYLKGHYEKPPYGDDTKRSVYHIRNLEVFRLKQISQPIDIFLSHDWPTDIWTHGDYEQLLRFKPYFKGDMESGKLGGKPCKELLDHLQPKYYFAAHLHCKFAALVQHSDKKTTKFLALDKCLPKKKFMQVVDVPHDANAKIELQYDLEWLTILNLTNHLLSVKALINYMPDSNSPERGDFTPTKEEKAKISSKFSEDLTVPNNFTKTAPGYDPQTPKGRHVRQPPPQMNQQTALLCKTIEIDDPLVLLNAFTDTRFEDSIPESTNESSISEDSDAYETFIKATPTRLSLSLPKPKYEQSDLDETLPNESVSGICEKTESTTVSLEENTSVVSESHSTEGEDRSETQAKKFKRRNASIYTSEES